jgi:hypothetical protein
MCSSPDQPNVMMASLKEEPVTSRTTNKVSGDVNRSFIEFEVSLYVLFNAD